MAVFNDHDQQQVRLAIEAAERQTSGQIRVCVEETCSEEPVERAAKYFHKLEMHQTKQRNGVLIYLATKDRKFAIIGDAGINQLVPDNFWDSTKESMLTFFKQGDLVGGIVDGLQHAGSQLKTYFPHKSGGSNELPDDIAFMNGQ
ncbi:TPM domain-containing protein [Mucilaginibacter koreensis]